MSNHFDARGLSGFMEHILGQPYYFAGEVYPRVGNVVALPAFADAEFLHAEKGISLDGVVKFQSGRPWKRFELLLTWAGMTLDFAAARLWIDGKHEGDGWAFFFPNGFQIEITGLHHQLHAQLHALPNEPRSIHWQLHGTLKDRVTLYGFSMQGGIARPPMNNVSALRRPRS